MLRKKSLLLRAVKILPQKTLKYSINTKNQMLRVTQKIGNFRLKKQSQTENKHNKKILASFKFLKFMLISGGWGEKTKDILKSLTPESQRDFFVLFRSALEPSMNFYNSKLAYFFLA